MIDSQTMKFAALSNFVAMLGGQIKSNQTISALMADIMSNIYLANSVIYYTNEEGGDERIGAYCLYRLAIDTNDKINSVIFNYPTENRGMKLLLYLLRPTRVQFDFNKNRELMAHFKRNESDILCLLKEDIILDEALSKLENLSNYKKEAENLCLDQTKDVKNKYRKLYDNVISVGEYPNQ